MTKLDTSEQILSRSFFQKYLQNLLKSNKSILAFCIGFLLFAPNSFSQQCDVTPTLALNSGDPGNCLDGLNIEVTGNCTSYRWFLDGVEIYGETSSSINTSAYGNGDYTVVGTGGIDAPTDTSLVYNVLCEICGNGLDDDGDGDVDCDDSDCASYAGCTDCDSDGVADNADYCFCDASLLLSLNTYGCGFPDSCSFLVTDVITIDTSGVNYDPSYITTYILADSLGEIVALNNLPEFANPPAGKFMIVAINYEDDASITNLAVGNDLNTVTANCFDMSNALTLKVCPEEVCGDGIDNNDNGLIDCDDPHCAPEVTATRNLASACVNEDFSFGVDSVIIGATYSWTFGVGANPATATGPGAHTVDYSSCGTKEIIVEVTENACTIRDTITVDVIDNTAPTFTAPTDATVYYSATCQLDTLTSDLEMLLMKMIIVVLV